MMTHERLDETLDRVAAQITAVPPDATFVRRLRPRLDRPMRHALGLRTAVIAALLLALAVSAAMLRQNGSAIGRVDTVARSSSERPVVAGAEVVLAEREPVLAVVPTPNAAAAAIRLSTRALPPATIVHTATRPTIPALFEPPVLDVAHLQLDPLVVQPVDVSSLEIADLAVLGLGGVEDPKE